MYVSPICMCFGHLKPEMDSEYPLGVALRLAAFYHSLDLLLLLPALHFPSRVSVLICTPSTYTYASCYGIYKDKMDFDPSKPYNLVQEIKHVYK